MSFHSIFDILIPKEFGEKLYFNTHTKVINSVKEAVIKTDKLLTDCQRKRNSINTICIIPKIW